MAPFYRRKFLRSLSRTALVLPFADLVALAAPPHQQDASQNKKKTPVERSYDAKPAPPPPGPKSPIEGTPLGQRQDLNPRYCLKVLAMFRLVNPDRELRIAGGREVHLGSLQALGL